MDTGSHDLERLVGEPEPYLEHHDALVRRLAVSALADHLDLRTTGLVALRLRADPDPAVRAEAAEVLGTRPDAIPALLAARRDESRVVEAVVTALGALRHADSVPWLIEQARSADDALVREAAVAALGEIGDAAAVPTLIELSETGPPQVRRRSVVALTVFDGDDVRNALRRSVTDRNPMVREAAEMVVGPAEEWQPVTLQPPDATSGDD